MGSPVTRFKLGDLYPSEGFVQRAVEWHFLGMGYRLTPIPHADFCFTHPETNRRWLIEAKGVTAATGLDYHTGLGQLVQRIRDDITDPAIAVPATPFFRRRFQRMSPRVRTALHLTWLLVRADQSVETVTPDQCV